jgi:pimeloyl-ACP methyl ester carboxylesterase
MTTSESQTQQPPTPDPALKLLDRYVGTWDMKGRTLDSDVDNVSGRATFEWLPAEMRQLVGLVRKDPEGAVDGVVAANQWYPADPDSPMRLWSAPGDGAVGTLPRVAEALSVMLREGARQGAAGMVHDVIAGSLDWGFALDEVRAPVALWYGTLDPMVSPEHGEYYALRLPDASQVRSREGDYLLAIPLWEEVLGSLGRPPGH